jgi:SMI1 / KNR4 family (SUKH-1)
MRDLSELNINEGGEPVRRPAPAEGMIQAFQAHFEILLPPDYLILLRHSNGGHPELDTIKPVGRPGTSEWAVSKFYHLDGDKTSHTSLWAAMAEWRRVLGNTALVFAADGGGNQFFLDLKTSPPVVKVCVHDENFLSLEIAPSLEAFIDGLYLDPDMT